MNRVLGYGKQHAIALSIFAAYMLGWFILSTISVPSGYGVQAGACARGMLMLPLLGGLAISFVYCLTLLLFAIFNQARSKFFWVLLALALAPPTLVLNVLQ